MKWAMSDDYAALITTVILAVLAVGTVQTYTLVRRTRDAMLAAMREATDSRNRVIEAIRSGQQPAVDDLTNADVLLRPDGWMRRAAPPYIAAAVWLGVCGVLVFVQVRVLIWAGTHSPATDPGLAEMAFYSSASSVVLLVLEGAARGILGLLAGVRGEARRIVRATPEERAEFDRALDAYRSPAQ